MKTKPFTPGIRKFLGRLKRTKRNWEIGYESIRIRVYKKSTVRQCPMCYIAKAPVSNEVAWWEVNDKLGLSTAEAHSIAGAADNRNWAGNPELRVTLLEACGLEESK